MPKNLPDHWSNFTHCLTLKFTVHYTEFIYFFVVGIQVQFIILYSTFFLSLNKVKEVLSDYLPLAYIYIYIIQSPTHTFVMSLFVMSVPLCLLYIYIYKPTSQGTDVCAQFKSPSLLSHFSLIYHEFDTSIIPTKSSNHTSACITLSSNDRGEPAISYKLTC